MLESPCWQRAHFIRGLSSPNGSLSSLACAVAAGVSFQRRIARRKNNVIWRPGGSDRADGAVPDAPSDGLLNAAGETTLLWNEPLTLKQATDLLAIGRSEALALLDVSAS